MQLNSTRGPEAPHEDGQPTGSTIAAGTPRERGGERRRVGLSAADTTRVEPYISPVKVVPIEEKDVSKSKRRLGFLEGRFSVPDEFDSMFAKEIEEMFYGAPK
ncbi:hypothetical protein [uncultured Herbaspirillum sp.]|uniref:hypothetical protein n=1 Tax=uncultured Herbaspirillum sp. TaxID=160236 RepID=UPI002601CF7B|nr:hypothetical protein [uncultured Herbaspirillum sp.]